METFAFIHAAVSYEDPHPAPELSLELHLPSSAWMGIASAAVVVAALSGSPDKATAATTPVSHGSTGAEVQAVQKALGVQADGQYGAKTAAAVTDFQIRQGLKQVDGVVGQETATALGLNEKYQPTGYVDTASGAGLNVRTGPGLEYRVLGTVPDGTYLYEVDEDVVVSDGYYWSELTNGDWVATNYTYDNAGYDYYYEFPASYDGGYGDGYDGYNEEYVSYYDGADYDYYYGGYEEPVSYSDRGDQGGFVDTYSGVGLNIRSAPGLENAVVGGAYEDGYVDTGEGVVYEDGYAWVPVSSGGWVASDYLDPDY